MKTNSIGIVTQVIFSACLVAMFGCATTPSGTTSAVTTTNTKGNITGNWQGTLTPAAGTPQLNTLSGAINQYGASGTAGQFTSGVFHIGADCFVASPIVPTEGEVNATAVTLDSYGVNQQFFHLQAQSSADASTFQGTYTVDGGCADGAHGSIAAVRYSALSGTYQSAATMLTVNQDAAATGSGTFLLSGTAKFTGNSCFTAATATEQAVNYVQGSTVHLTLQTNDTAGATYTLTGTANPAADTISDAQYLISGGKCDGQQGSLTFTR